jgi:hypothetical protein
MTSFVNPLGGAPVVLVTSIGAAEGARGAAAALACAGADLDRATLLVDVGARPPRPTLLASAAAQRLEERLIAHLPEARVAARGRVCHLSVGPDEEGLAAASAAATIVRDSLSVLNLPAATLREVVDGTVGPRPTGVLLRADIAADRPLLALAAGELIGRGLAVGVLKRRLSWVTERRALFGVLPPETNALPGSIVRRLTEPVGAGTTVSV